MKKIYFKNLIKLFITTLIVLCINIYFAKSEGICIILKMKVELGNFSNSKIEIKKNNSMIITCHDQEKYELKLDQDCFYSFTFDKDGYISKTVTIDTKNITQKRWTQGFPKRTIEVILEKQKNPNVLLCYKNPVGALYFDKIMNNFFEIKNYSTSTTLIPIEHITKTQEITLIKNINENKKTENKVIEHKTTENKVVENKNKVENKVIEHKAVENRVTENKTKIENQNVTSNIAPIHSTTKGIKKLAKRNVSMDFSLKRYQAKKLKDICNKMLNPNHKKNLFKSFKRNYKA